MNDLFIAFAAAFVVPLLFQSRKIAILGLSLQGILLSMVPAAHVHDWTPQVVLECIILLALRGVFAPWMLYRCVELYRDDSEFTLIGKNIFQWSLAALLMTVAYGLGNHLAPDNSSEAVQVGTAAGCILIGMLVLSNQASRLGQAIGLLTIESGIALVELLSPHAMPFAVSIGVNVVYLLLLFTIRIYLSQPTAQHPADQQPTILLNDDKAAL